MNLFFDEERYYHFLSSMLIDNQSTILKDDEDLVHYIAKRIAYFNLEIQSRIFHGTNIVDEEVRKRSAITIEFYSDHHAQSFHLKQDRESKYDKVSELLMSLMHQYDYRLTDICFKNLMIHILTVLIVIIALEFSDIYGERTGLIPVVALASYFTVVNPTMLVEVGDKEELISGVLSQDYTGTGGPFIGMVIALVSSKLFLSLNQNDALKIKMPDTVPSNVAKAFSNMIPGILTVFIIATFSFLVFNLSGYTLFEVINLILQKPLEGILLSFPGYLLITSLMLVLWSAGIHGDGVLGPLIDPLLITAVL
ncbi:MAG: PTS sugar transporter subunit IIC [Erysipelothrix sp.]|nr:PTS sugar transporter subunit IIC [Erysipelothrix sp.]